MTTGPGDQPPADPYGAPPPPGPPHYGAPPPPSAHAYSAPYGPPGYGQPYAPSGGSPGGPPTGLAVTAMALGIVAVSFAWMPVIGVLGLLTGAASLVLGVVARRRAGDGRAGGPGMALTGIVTGSVAVLLGLASTAFIVWAISMDAATPRGGGPAWYPEEFELTDVDPPG